MVTIEQLAKFFKSLNYLPESGKIHGFAIKDYDDEYGRAYEHYIVTFHLYDDFNKRSLKKCLVKCEVLKAFVNNELIIWVD